MSVQERPGGNSLDQDHATNVRARKSEITANAISGINQQDR
jgi:hypothetical protein